MTEYSCIYQEIFYIDGSLRDIYVKGTTEQDWQKLLDFLRTSSYSLECIVGRKPQPLPEQVTDLFECQIDASVTLLIDQERLKISCHFFTRDEIEFDISPEDFQIEQQVEYLLDFIRAIGHQLNKTVVLTAENCADFPLFLFDPETGEETWFFSKNNSK